MHSTEAGGNAVPAFLTKLWKLVEDSKCDDLICWGMNGTSFIIRNQARFAKELLPLYFKHNNMASFIRQLNMYGFRKVVNIEQGGLRPEKDEMEFQHLYFLKGHQYFLDLIKRKVPTGKVPEEGKGKTDLVNSMLADMKQLKGKQESMDTKLSSMKRENEALWREVANLRQKHVKQQQIVNKLIQFLLSLVQPNRGIGLKRKLPLMINDGSRDSKAPLLGCCLPFENEAIPDTSIASPDTDEILKGSGPVIHDVTDTLDDESVLTNDAPLIPPAAEMEEDVSVIADPVIINTDPVVINDPVFDLEETGTLIHIPEQDPDSIVMLDPSTIVIETPADLEKVITLTNEPIENLNSTDEGIKNEIETKGPSQQAETASSSLLPKASVPGCSNTSVTDARVDGTDIFREAIRNLNEIKDKTMEKRKESSEIISLPSAATSLTSIPIDDLSLENFIDNSSKSEELTEMGKISAPSITDAMVPISDYKFKHECRKDMSDDVDTIQHELDTLKELLSGNGYSLDVSTLLGLFNPDDPLPGTSLSSQDILSDKNEINGTELIQYNPSLMELADEDSEFFDPINSKSAAEDYETILFDNVETILPESVINEETLATPDPLLSMPSLESSKKKIKSKKNP